MSDPTTAETPTMRARLEAAAKPYLRTESDTNIWAAVDAILREMLEPSEGMERQAANGVEPVFRLMWRKAVQYIQDGGS